MNDSVEEVMSKTVYSMSIDRPVKEALQMMISRDIGSIVLTKNGAPFGIITERDVMKNIAAAPHDNLEKPAVNFGSTNLLTCNPNTHVWDAFTIMLRNRIRRLPVLESGKLVGIVTERDLFKWVVRVTYEPNIPSDLAKLILQAE
jgi:CBS domain-containing protein